MKKQKGQDGMLRDMIIALVSAKSSKEKEKAYRSLERVGVDKITADVMAAEIRKELVEMGT